MLSNHRYIFTGFYFQFCEYRNVNSAWVTKILLHPPRPQNTLMRPSLFLSYKKQQQGRGLITKVIYTIGFYFVSSLIRLATNQTNFSRRRRKKKVEQKENARQFIFHSFYPSSYQGARLICICDTLYLLSPSLTRVCVCV